MVLPAGFALPPAPYMLGLMVGLGVVGGGLWRSQPSVTEATGLALVPWMAVGAVLHASYQVAVAPVVVRPLLGTPAVYVSTGIVAGGVWLVARYLTEDVALGLGSLGALSFVVGTGLLVTSTGVFRPFWPLLGLAIAVGVSWGVWRLFQRQRPEAAAVSPLLGGLVVFAHTLDGVSTAIGVDVLGFGERSPASRVLLDLAGILPTAEFIGVGWLFVAVKVVLGVFVVYLLVEYVREAPARGYLLLSAVAAVGLGPGIQNLLLYLVV